MLELYRRRGFVDFLSAGAGAAEEDLGESGFGKRGAWGKVRRFFEEEGGGGEGAGEAGEGGEAEGHGWLVEKEGWGGEVGCQWRVDEIRYNVQGTCG